MVREPWERTPERRHQGYGGHERLWGCRWLRPRGHEQSHLFERGHLWLGRHRLGRRLRWHRRQLRRVIGSTTTRSRAAAAVAAVTPGAVAAHAMTTPPTTHQAAAAAGGGGGAQWVNNTYVASPTFTNASSTANTSTSCTPNSTNGGEGAAAISSTGPGDAGCAGDISFTLNGTPVVITQPTPAAVTAGSTVNFGVTYSAGSPYASFAINGWAITGTGCTGLSMSGSAVGAGKTATVTGTAPTAAGSYTCTMTATSGDANAGTRATRTRRRSR